MLIRNLIKRSLCINPRCFSSTVQRQRRDGAIPIVGIDLGTTNSCVAMLEDSVPVVIEN